jgi:leucyl-tRNA synthetase
MVLKDGAVMSKSKGNVVDPDTMLQKYGADALRLYVMFVAPPEKEVEWTDSGLEGSFRFLARAWRIADHWNETVGGDGVARPQQRSLNAAEKALRRKTHDTIRRVTADIEQRQQLNTAVSALMELVNELYLFSERTATGGPSHRSEEDLERVGEAERSETIAVVREALEALILMLAPFAPHTAEELWCMLGYETGLADASWPSFDAEVAKAEEITIPIQVNGKVRGRLTVPAGTPDKELEAMALADLGVKPHLAGKTVQKVVVVKGRLVSIVVQ